MGAHQVGGTGAGGPATSWSHQVAYEGRRGGVLPQVPSAIHVLERHFQDYHVRRIVVLGSLCRPDCTQHALLLRTSSRHMRAYHGLVSDITDEVPSETGKRPGSTSQAPPLKKRKPEVEQSAQVMLLKWVVSSFQPWSIVESPGIREFVRCLSSSFEMPTSSEMVAIAAENVEKVKVEVRRLLKDCEHYSIGCLPFVHQDKPYASVNVTFCTSSFERKSLSLGVVVGKCTKEALSSLLSEFSLPPSKVAHVAVTGGADSLNLGLAQGGDSCVLYQMDTIVEEACASSAVIDALVSFVVGDSSKHANTGFVQRAYTSLQALAESSDGSDLNEGQKMIIGALTTILKPFYDAYTTISGEVYPTVGLAIPVFRRIRDVLAKLDVVQLTTDFIDKTAMSRVKSFYNNLIKVFSTSFASILCDDPPLMWTVPLDPRLVHMVGLSVKEKESVMKQLVDKVKDGKLAVGNSGDGNDNGTKSSSKAQEPSTMGGIFWGDDGTVPENSGNETEAIASYAQANVNRYLTAVKSQRRIDDPLAWWNSNQNDFPELAGMARVWLGASAVGPPVDQRRDYPQGHIELMAFLHDSATLVAGV